MTSLRPAPSREPSSSPPSVGTLPTGRALLFSFVGEDVLEKDIAEQCEQLCLETSLIMRFIEEHGLDKVEQALFCDPLNRECPFCKGRWIYRLTTDGDGRTSLVKDYFEVTEPCEIHAKHP